MARPDSGTPSCPDTNRVSPICLLNLGFDFAVQTGQTKAFAVPERLKHGCSCRRQGLSCASGRGKCDASGRLTATAVQDQVDMRVELAKGPYLRVLHGRDIRSSQPQVDLQEMAH